MKHCKKCGAQKADHDFYTRNATCKDCVKAAVRANYARNREHYREYERSRNNLPHRVEARNQYLQTERGRERSNAAKRAYIKRNPEKRAAHNALESAIRSGKVWKSPCCMAPGCFSQDRLHAHHSDYEKPLSVVWLCNSCHTTLHWEFTNRLRAAA
ncbi:hypothetical protein [Stutzerimonas stutzeri]|uniref:hypothetical protein n=1 Tax=Stutzerimonas stutzeri TaxID=316 RepID=UPI00244A02EE|nr:hypothetical protein [Stutzerimonas stutzeri]MDH0157315.1 hypothetical protein [Stutzerimonas stutzeri]